MPGSRLSSYMLELIKEGYDASELRVKTLYNSDEGYVENLRGAFDFFRAFDGGHYSSRSKMRIANAADTAARRRDQGSSDGDGLPVLTILERPFNYDEMTEVKSGGVAAMLVMFYSEEGGRMMLAVHRQARGNGLGSVLAACARNNATEIMTWVNRNNVEGQRFLLRSGFAPTAMNSAGAVCYSTVGADSEEEEYAGITMDASPPPLSLSGRERDRIRERISAGAGATSATARAYLGEVSGRGSNF